MMDRYVLDDAGVPVLEPDFEAWRRWSQENDEIIAETRVGDCLIGSNFLLMAHGVAANGSPLLFDTLVDNGPLHDTRAFYVTRDEALAGHAAMVARVRQAMEAIRRYVLDENGDPVFEPDLEAWGRWYWAAKKVDELTIGRTHLGDDQCVETTYLGVSHAAGDAPQLYKTSVFEGPLHGETYTYATRDEARAGHMAMVARVRLASEGKR
jgi:hypothetical protein